MWHNYTWQAPLLLSLPEYAVLYCGFTLMENTLSSSRFIKTDEQFLQ
jgi:hypothetical protein